MLVVYRYTQGHGGLGSHCVEPRGRERPRQRAPPREVAHALPASSTAAAIQMIQRRQLAARLDLERRNRATGRR